MKLLLPLALAFSLFGTSLVAFAEEGTIRPRIQQGDWEIGGGFNLTNSSRSSAYSYGSRSTYFSLSGAGQYFISDGLSIGLDAALATAGHRSTTVSAGPVATKYLFQKDRLAPYVSMAPIRWSKTEGLSGRLSSSVRVGAKYFLTDSVAFGPALDYEHQWESRWHGDADEVSFLGLFSIHL